MPYRHALAVSAALLALATAAQAADTLKSGEWEDSITITLKGGPQIPPDQLAMMKKMGIAVPGSGDPIISHACVTPEMAKADKPFDNTQGNDGCELKNYQRSGNKATGQMVCNGDVKGGGAFEMVMDSSTAYHGGWTVKGVSKEHGPVEQRFAISGKWLKADCDKVQP